ncbi:MAG: DUF6653 family protein [Pseudomonadota bacterium]
MHGDRMGSGRARWSEALAGWTAAAFAMDDDAWARHANPLSFWSRLPILPLAVLVLIARPLLGWWCVPLLLALAVWTWINPRAFAPPARMDAWASRAVMGERLWIDRAWHALPAHHVAAAERLTMVQIAACAPLVLGLVMLDWPLAITATALTVGAKLWFLDRMVWLHDDLLATGPRGPATRSTGVSGTRQDGGASARPAVRL